MFDKKIMILLSPELEKKVKDKARYEGLPMSTTVRRIIKGYFDKNERSLKETKIVIKELKQVIKELKQPENITPGDIIEVEHKIQWQNAKQYLRDLKKHYKGKKYILEDVMLNGLTEKQANALNDELENNNYELNWDDVYPNQGAWKIR